MARTIPVVAGVPPARFQKNAADTAATTVKYTEKWMPHFL